MNYISELAYSSQVAHTTKSAKDKKQKGQYQPSTVLTDDLTDEGTAALMTKINTDVWQDEDRRCGEDRRKKDIDRGRYLESRLQKDRRYSAKLDVKI